MIWCWILKFFTSVTGFFDIFITAKHEWKCKKKILSHSWNKFHIQIQTIEFSIYYVFFGFKTCFFQTLDTVCKTWCDVTIACYFHTVKITLLIFSQCENNSLWKISLLFNDKTRYSTAENVIKKFTPNKKLDFYSIYLNFNYYGYYKLHLSFLFFFRCLYARQLINNDIFKK